MYKCRQTSHNTPINIQKYIFFVIEPKKGLIFVYGIRRKS